MLESVDIYRFDDGWRWVRLVSGQVFYASGLRVEMDLKRHVYLVLEDLTGKAHVLFKAEIGGNIFGMAFFSPGNLWEMDDASPLPVKGGLVARAWPLGTELNADVDEVQFGMAENVILLPQVLPDRVWQRMAERESEVSTPQEALDALRYAFADLDARVVPRDHSFDRALIADIFVPPALSFQLIFGQEVREWMVTHEDGKGSKGTTFVEALDGAVPNYGGPVLRKSEFDALWDDIVVPGEGTFDPEPYFLLDVPHPAFLPLDTFVALAREEGLL